MLGPDDVTLEGKVALITGAAQGIGEAIALTFARFGASVAMCDRNADGLAFVSKEIDGLGPRVVTGVLDVRDEDQVDAFVDDVERALDHRIDVLVNNAGGGFESDFMSVNAKGQDALIRENFSSVTHFVRACVPHMPEGGSIINVTSIEAHRAAPGDGSHGSHDFRGGSIHEHVCRDALAQGLKEQFDVQLHAYHDYSHSR